MSPQPPPDPDVSAPRVDVAPPGVTVSTEMLYTAENRFFELADVLDAARTYAQQGEGKGDFFGLLSQLSDLGGSHDTFIDAMCGALAHGSQRMNEVAERLRDVAHAYAESDARAAGTITGTGG